MNVGYVRLSRDDDKRNYTSIENQKLMISQYVAGQKLVIDRWYEDDGISGYKFDRPGFNQLMNDLEKDVDAVYVKDFSRLGRHNAKVLLLLDEFQERGKHLIVIDDNYDSSKEEDDTIGIKTWYNERYVKETSKKIKHAISARQKEGTLKTQPPFGYKRNDKDKSVIEIVPKEAEFVRLVGDLYLQGLGYRKIAGYLTNLAAPTPSMVRRERELKEGRITHNKVVTNWSDGMVKELLDNDYYIGTLRLHKRARATIHGKDRRVPKKEQCIFENNHPPIMDKDTFELIQKMKLRRVKNNDRGSRGKRSQVDALNAFGSCLFCKDCGSHLTPIRRKTLNGEHKYYICSTYNTKGKLYCAKAHLIEEQDLIEDVFTYLKFCRDSLWEVIGTYEFRDSETESESIEKRRVGLQRNLDEEKHQLRVLYAQKIRDLSVSSVNKDIIKESYEGIQNDILEQIHNLEIQLIQLNETSLKITGGIKPQNALEVLNNMIENRAINRKDIEILIERIEVDVYGHVEINLRYDLSNISNAKASVNLNCKENEIISCLLNLMMDDDRGFTSVKYLSRKLTDLGYDKTTDSVLAYIGLMLHLGVLKKNDNQRKPYTIIKSASEIQNLLCDYTKHLHR